MKPRLSQHHVIYLGLFLLLAAFLVATFSFRKITDTQLNSLQTRALVLHGDVNLDRYDLGPAYFAVRRGEAVYSIYGVGSSLVAAPVYVWLARLTTSDRVLQAAAAIPLVAVSVLLMYRLLLRLARPRIAVAGSLVFGFGTTMWPLAAMAFFQHGSVALFQLLGLAGLFSDRPRGPVLAGLGFAAAAFIRPPAGIPLLLVGLFYLTRGKRPLASYVAGAVMPLLGVIVQNRWIWGEWLTGGYQEAGIGFHAKMPQALFGLLFGWWRGLLVYSPVLLIGFVGSVMAWRRRREFAESRLVVLGVSCVATILFYSKWTTWWGGLNQFGYRYLLDVVPFLVVLGAYAVSRSERARTIAIPLAVLSIMTMTFGAEPNAFGWDGVLFATRVSDTSLGQAWIVFLDRPVGALVRLCGVAAIGALLALASRRLGAGRVPLFDKAVTS